MGRKARPRGYIRCNKLRHTAVYKRLPTIFKKAMELYENCGVNITLVAENQGVYHYYNTANMSKHEMFERYSMLVHESPEIFVTEVPILDSPVGDSVSQCADLPENCSHVAMNAVCVDELDMNVDDVEEMRCNFETEGGNSANLNGSIMDSESAACGGSTAAERKKIRKNKEKITNKIAKKAARIQARKAVRIQNKLAKKTASSVVGRNDADVSKNKNISVHGDVDNRVRIKKPNKVPACNVNQQVNIPSTGEMIQKDSHGTVWTNSNKVTGGKKKALMTHDHTQKQSNDTKALKDTNACNRLHDTNSTDTFSHNVSGNSPHYTTMPKDNISNWLNCMKHKLATNDNNAVMLRNDPIFQMFANF